MDLIETVLPHHITFIRSGVMYRNHCHDLFSRFITDDFSIGDCDSLGSFILTTGG